MKKKRLSRSVTVLVLTTSIIWLAGCGISRGQRPGALNQADSDIFSTLYYTSLFLDDIRPKIEGCGVLLDGTINSHPDCGTLVFMTSTFNTIAASYTRANEIYQDWRVALIKGETPNFAVVDSTIQLLDTALMSDGILYQMYNIVRFGQ
jgi:hypothetical protein